MASDDRSFGDKLKDTFGGGQRPEDEAPASEPERRQPEDDASFSESVDEPARHVREEHAEPDVPTERTSDVTTSDVTERTIHETREQSSESN
jgi:hypothetical protein